MSTNLFFRKGLQMTIILLILSSCVIQKNAKMMQAPKTDSTFKSYSNSHQMQYKTKPGDHLYIKLYSIDPKTSKFFQTDFPTLTNSTYLYLNSYMIDEEGFVSFSFIEKIKVSGLTINQIRDKLQAKFDEYFKETRVVVKLINYQVSVLGEVNSPGTFTVEKDQINLLQAIGLAKGTTEFGNLKSVKVIRQSTEGSNVYYVDLSSDKLLELEQYYLEPNDVIYIEPRNTKSFSNSKFPYALSVSTFALIVSLIAILL